MGVLLFTFYQAVSGQGYTNWITGDATDFVAESAQFGLVLAGGGTDNDQAMTWMLERAGGGDVVVLRATGADGYNSYFYSELGVGVNSVETIRFDDASAAYHPYVIQRLEEAEVLFIAGGDQYDYFTYWKDTPVEDAINALINEKKIAVGGTSAGMAILGGAYYAPSNSSLESVEALADPFHPNINVLGTGDFINVPFLSNLVTDTHYDQRDRHGRHFTMMARLTNDQLGHFNGIACNEFVAVCIDSNRVARVFGEYPDYEDFAYFLKSNCQDDFKPELIEPGQPLTWDRNQAAVKVYKMKATLAGNNSFDLNDWVTAAGGDWESWYALNGQRYEVGGADGDCNSMALGTVRSIQQPILQVSPNPFVDNLTIFVADGTMPFKACLYDLLGHLVWNGTLKVGSNQIELSGLPVGIYQLRPTLYTGISALKIVKQ